MGKISFNVNEVDNGFCLNLWREGEGDLESYGKNLVFTSMREVLNAIEEFAAKLL